MPSRRAVLAGLCGLGSSLALSGCSLGDSSDPASVPSESHLANAIAPLHPEASDEPDGLEVSFDYLDAEGRSAAIDESAVDADAIDLAPVIPAGMEDVAAATSLRSVQSWRDGGAVHGQYRVTRGEFTRSAYEQERGLPAEPDDSTAGFDRYERDTLEGQSYGSEQLGVSDSTVVDVRIALGSWAGEDQELDLLSEALDAESADDRVTSWLADPLDVLDDVHELQVFIGRFEDGSAPPSTTVHGEFVDGATVEQTQVYANPDADAFDEDWEESEASWLYEDVATESELEVRDTMAIWRASVPVEERYPADE